MYLDCHITLKQHEHFYPKPHLVHFVYYNQNISIISKTFSNQKYYMYMIINMHAISNLINEIHHSN